MDTKNIVIKGRPDLFTCHSCDSTFVTIKSMEGHVKAFHPDSRSNSSVTLLGKQAKVRRTQSSSDAGTGIHLKDVPCRLCNKFFQNQNELTQHMNTIHSEVSITLTRPTPSSKPSVKTGEKPSISILKRPLQVGNNKEEVTKRTKLTPQSTKTSTELSSGFVLNGNFEITEVVRSLVISHMNNTSQTNWKDTRNTVAVKSPNLKPKSNLPVSIIVPGAMQESDTSSSEDEFEGESVPNPVVFVNETIHGDSSAFVPDVTLEDDNCVEDYSCGACSAKFSCEQKLECHINQQHKDSQIARPYKCQVCTIGRGFARKEHLTKHMNSVHSGMKFTCEFCGKDISRRDHLVRHIRSVHRCEIPSGLDLLNGPAAKDSNRATGNVPQTLIDEISDKALASMQPKPRKPYTKCDMCEKTFSKLDQLFLHQREAHGDIRKYTCDLCPKSFKRREHLQKHVVLHTGEKKFSCEYCAKSFPRRDALQDHLRRLHEAGLEPPTEEFPCSLCDRVFHLHSNLVRHRNQVHNITLAVAIRQGPAATVLSGQGKNGGTSLSTSVKKRPPIPALLPIKHFLQSHNAVVAKKELTM